MTIKAAALSREAAPRAAPHPALPLSGARGATRAFERKCARCARAGQDAEAANHHGPQAAAATAANPRLGFDFSRIGIFPQPVRAQAATVVGDVTIYGPDDEATPVDGTQGTSADVTAADISTPTAADSSASWSVAGSAAERQEPAVPALETPPQFPEPSGTIRGIPPRVATKPCSVTAAFSSIPSGTIIATISGRRLGASFEMVGDFKPSSAACDCGRGEYRQFVRGTFTSHGENVALPLGGGVMIHPTKFQEDGAAAQPKYYGYRNHQNTNNIYTPGRAGCHYSGEDRPGVENADGSGLALHLDFQGKMVDTLDNDRPLANASWSVAGSVPERGEVPVPPVETPPQFPEPSGTIRVPPPPASGGGSPRRPPAQR